MVTASLFLCNISVIGSILIGGESCTSVGYLIRFLQVSAIKPSLHYSQSLKLWLWLGAGVGCGHDDGENNDGRGDYDDDVGDDDHDHKSTSSFWDNHSWCAMCWQLNYLFPILIFDKMYWKELQFGYLVCIKAQKFWRSLMGCGTKKLTYANKRQKAELRVAKKTELALETHWRSA